MFRRQKVSHHLSHIITRLVAVTTIILISTQSQGAEKAQLMCPDSPNCVSSLATDSHAVAPLNFSGQATDSIHTLLLNWLKNQPDATITKTEKTVLTAEFRSRLLGFVDDMTLTIQPDGMVEVRSASRTGYYDFGVNRSRIEKLRSDLQTTH